MVILCDANLSVFNIIKASFLLSLGLTFFMFRVICEFSILMSPVVWNFDLVEAGVALVVHLSIIKHSWPGAHLTNDISKFNQNLPLLWFKCTLPITMKSCTHHDSYTVVTCAKFHCVANFFMIGWAYSKLEHSKFWSNCIFDWNSISGIRARSKWHIVQSVVKITSLQLCRILQTCSWTTCEMKYLINHMILLRWGLSQYNDAILPYLLCSHSKDTMVSWPCYLDNRNPYN